MPLIYYNTNVCNIIFKCKDDAILLLLCEINVTIVLQYGFGNFTGYGSAHLVSYFAR